MEQEAGLSPAPPRLHSNIRLGPVKAKKSRQTGRQTDLSEESDSSNSEGCLSRKTRAVRKINFILLKCLKCFYNLLGVLVCCWGF